MAAKTPTLEDIADAGLIPHDVELRCIVRNRTFLENINGIDFSFSGYRSFIGLLKGNGRLYFNGEGFRYPSTAARAVRAEIEGRNVSATTGGWPYWRGRIAIATRPRGGDWLEDEVTGWLGVGLDLVVSLLEPEEAAQLGLAQEGNLAVSGGVHFVSFPIPDRGIPASITRMQAVIQKIIDALDAGHTVPVHCRPGIGRSGLIAIGALLLSGVALDRAIETVTAARGLPVPETEAQVAWLRQFASAEATLHT